MIRAIAAAPFAFAALVLACPAAAQAPADAETSVESIIVPNCGWAGCRMSPDAPAVKVITQAELENITEAELTHYLRRLPTLADLSKERWNETHRRFDGLRGRPARRA